ncbi:uncharacterized protein ACLA_055270 [Aspergillus clavatus NRRL 1]|uniref:Aristolochene synthase n=1 Tax=Aspergillus clavatus (strain ATCC 1007 / CBS 513.65 / DSM 816 / NCTC 3887 / NRRL 1 / QM 1276 / 107) TaxID=344612 RepID=A1C9F6_ASPCL|nr:uncharacterized protein ACLA_055270 [Aspergillus clavatus NRRL 1]EAW13480.1 conserved hypothetical protein [Aspergillus clavatus NRRL 1]
MHSLHLLPKFPSVAIRGSLSQSISLCTPHTLRRFKSSSERGVKQGTDYSRIRNVSYAFDPVKSQTSQFSDGRFGFLTCNNVANLPELQHVNCLVPSALKVPWITRFPGSLQSKYWAEAEAAARDLIRIIFTKHPQNISERYIEAMIDAAVSFTVNVAPMGNLSRTTSLAQAYILVFLHDDAVESRNFDAAIPREFDESDGHTYAGFEKVSRDILREDPAQGKRFLEGIVSWGTLPQTIQPDQTFATLADYVLHRVEDVGADPVFRSVEFASDIDVTEEDEQVVERVKSLCAKHYALANDLYSYPKEAFAQQEHGEPLLNGVKVVQDLMNVPPSSAMSILRWIILDLEREMSEEYERLSKAESTTHVQLIYARALIIAVAGNMFYSATSYRYARFIEGSEVVQ